MEKRLLKKFFQISNLFSHSHSLDTNMQLFNLQARKVLKTQLNIIKNLMNFQNSISVQVISTQIIIYLKILVHRHPQTTHQQRQQQQHQVLKRIILFSI